MKTPKAPKGFRVISTPTIPCMGDIIEGDKVWDYPGWEKANRPGLPIQHGFYYARKIEPKAVKPKPVMDDVTATWADAQRKAITLAKAWRKHAAKMRFHSCIGAGNFEQCATDIESTFGLKP